LTVLAAVTDVIKAAGGHETEVEYFAALMGSLGNNVEKNDPENLGTLSATVYLLSLVVRRVPYAVLVKSFDQTSPVLYNLLKIHGGDDDEQVHALLRYTVDSLGVILKVNELCTVTGNRGN